MLTHTYTRLMAWVKTHKDKCIAFIIGFALGLTTSAALYYHDYPFRAHFLDQQIEDFFNPEEPAPPPTFVIDDESVAIEGHKDEVVEDVEVFKVFEAQSSSPASKRPKKSQILTSSFSSSITSITSSTSNSSSTSSSQQAKHEAAPENEFPAFSHTVFPVSKAPNWGAMTSPEQWNRSYKEISTDEFVTIPRYDMETLTTPMATLLQPRNIAAITAKLFYSTRFFGAYDVDAGEYAGSHPGIDLKLALDTPVGSIAGGKVVRVSRQDGLGLYIVIEHRHPSDGVFFSVYGHLGATYVNDGDTVKPGTIIGTVGMTGNTTGPHLHLQIDRGPLEDIPSMERAAAVHPIAFIAKYAR